MDWSHIEKKSHSSIARKTLDWNPQGQGKQERPFHSCKRTGMKKNKDDKHNLG